MVNQQKDQNSGTNWQDEARRQASMYPNLEEFLNRMMPDSQSDFLREFFSQPTSNSNSGSGSSTSNAPPSAPPAQENSEENGANNSQNTKSAGGWNWQNWSDNWQNYHAQQQQQRPNNFQNSQRTEMFNEDDFSFLLQRIGQKMAENFAKAIGKLRSFRQIYDLVNTNPIAISIFTYLIYVLQLNLVYSITGFVAFMLPILIVPKYFLALGIFAAFMKSFGVSLTPLVLGGIFYEIITSLDPILLTLLGIWTIWKVLILRRPLVDINYWKHRMGVRCCSRRSSN